MFPLVSPWLRTYLSADAANESPLRRRRGTDLGAVRSQRFAARLVQRYVEHGMIDPQPSQHLAQPLAQLPISITNFEEESTFGVANASEQEPEPASGLPVPSAEANMPQVIATFTPPSEATDENIATHGTRSPVQLSSAHRATIRRANATAPSTGATPAATSSEQVETQLVPRFAKPVNDERDDPAADAPAQFGSETTDGSMVDEIERRIQRAAEQRLLASDANHLAHREPNLAAQPESASDSMVAEIEQRIQRAAERRLHQNEPSTSPAQTEEDRQASRSGAASDPSQRNKNAAAANLPLKPGTTQSSEQVLSRKLRSTRIYSQVEEIKRQDQAVASKAMIQRVTNPDRGQTFALESAAQKTPVEQEPKLPGSQTGSANQGQASRQLATTGEEAESNAPSKLREENSELTDAVDESNSAQLDQSPATRVAEAVPDEPTQLTSESVIRQPLLSPAIQTIQSLPAVQTRLATDSNAVTLAELRHADTVSTVTTAPVEAADRQPSANLLFPESADSSVVDLSSTAETNVMQRQATTAELTTAADAGADSNSVLMAKGRIAPTQALAEQRNRGATRSESGAQIERQFTQELPIDAEIEPFLQAGMTDVASNAVSQSTAQQPVLPSATSPQIQRDSQLVEQGNSAVVQTEEAEKGEPLFALVEKQRSLLEKRVGNANFQSSASENQPSENQPSVDQPSVETHPEKRIVLTGQMQRTSAGGSDLAPTAIPLLRAVRSTPISASAPIVQQSPANTVDEARATTQLSGHQNAQNIESKIQHVLANRNNTAAILSRFAEPQLPLLNRQVVNRQTVNEQAPQVTAISMQPSEANGAKKQQAATDLDALARQVTPFVKRLLAIEREREPFGL